MSSDAVTYDEVLPERATVMCRCGCGESLFPARAGDTIEVACPECGGSGWIYDDPACTAEGCPDCSQSGCRRCHHEGEVGGRGTIRVRLTEDPVEEYGDAEHFVVWRHVGTVVTDA